MNITDTKIPAVKLIEPKVFGDNRGFFMETWNERVFREAGIEATFVQDNHSRSVRNTLRGLHYQLPPHAQGKLVRVTRGEVFDVAVDLRRDSPSFGQWVGEYLSEDNKRMLWIPPGFAHGFLAREKENIVHYYNTNFRSSKHEIGIIWNDPSLKIKWPIKNPILSKKDKRNLTFKQFQKK